MVRDSTRPAQQETTTPAPGRLGWRDWLALYRLRDWEHKINQLRLLCYVGLSYALSGAAWDGRFALLLATITVMLVFAGIWSDYWDFRLEGQRNALATLVRQEKLSAAQALAMALAPVPPLVIFMWLTLRAAIEPIAPLLLLGLLLLVTTYASPPLRFKARMPFGFFATPLGVTGAFLAVWGTVASWRPLAGWMAALVFLFQCYAECLHILDEASVPGETNKLPEGVARQWAPRLPLCSAVFSATLAAVWPMFAAGMLGGLLRYRTVRRVAPAQLHALRRRLWGPLLCLPEFGFYGLAGLLRWVP